MLEYIPDLVVDLRYAGDNNFVGRPVDGYEANTAWMTKPAAEALRGVQAKLKEEGLGLILWDAYRPQRATDDFVQWAADPEDQTQKAQFYPDIEKKQLFAKGYISKSSGHSRGSTVDVGLINAEGVLLDMGCGFDTFGAVAAHGAEGLSTLQRHYRAKLRAVMENHGFTAYDAEWWHYRLAEEPYPDTFFNFPVRESGLAQSNTP